MSTARERALLGRDVVNQPWYLASVLLIDPGSLGLDELRARIAGGLHRSPRLRQRLAGPAWEDDASFGLARHVRRQSGAGADLTATMVDLMSARLSHDHPLWEVTLLDDVGPSDAVVARVHPALVDAGDPHLLEWLVSDEPDPETPTPLPWTPEPGPAGVDDVLNTLSATINDPAGMFGRATRAVAALVDEVRARPSGPRRRTLRLSSTRVRLADLVAVAGQRGVRVHDVVLALVAGVLRRLASEHGELTGDPVTLAPLAVRAADGRLLVEPRFCALPVGAVRGVRRLEAVSSVVDAEIGAHTVSAPQMVALPGLAAATLHALALRSVPEGAHEIFVGNVPGPRDRCFLGTVPVRGLYHVTRPTDEQRVCVLVTSYAGHVSFSFSGYDDVRSAAVELGAELARLRAESV